MTKAAWTEVNAMSLTPETYLDNLFRALGTKLIDGRPLYSHKEGHLRFARETGYALNDFDEKQQRDILSRIYSLYVKACSLKPILNAKELITEMKLGKERKMKPDVSENQHTDAKNGCTVKIVETLATSIPVSVDDLQDAEDIARRMYKNCEVVLDASNLVDTEFEATKNVAVSALINGRCACGSQEFETKEVSVSIVRISYTSGTAEYVSGSAREISNELTGHLICTGCGAVCKKP